MAFLLVTTISTWLGGRCIDKISQEYKTLTIKKSAAEKKILKQESTRKKRFVLTFVLVLNLGILIIIKYTNFFIDNINSVLIRNTSEPLQAVHFLLPLGISFYTFQSIGYLIDVYRGKYAADKSLGRFALFVSYFPQIIQGPISRYDNLATQLYAEHRFDYERVKFGIQRMLWGYFKKMVIADCIFRIISAAVPDGRCTVPLESVQ